MESHLLLNLVQFGTIWYNLVQFLPNALNTRLWCRLRHHRIRDKITSLSLRFRAQRPSLCPQMLYIRDT